MRAGTALGALFAFVLWFGAATPAFANAGAEQFARNLIDRGFAILRDDGISNTTRTARFHDFILPHIDARKTALFTLGNYRRGADPAELDAFVAAFADYSVAMYQTRLITYRNATLTITGSLENKPGDITVNTLGEEASLREPIRISFRLQSAGGTFKIIDIQVVGIWLSVEQRDQFASILAQNNGRVSALTSVLVERTKRMLADLK